MAINHADCTHPRTPAGRAACRRLRAHIKTDHGADGPHTQRANFQAAVAYDKARTGSGVPTGTKRRRKAASGDLKTTFAEACRAEVARRVAEAIDRGDPIADAAMPRVRRAVRAQLKPEFDGGDVKRPGTLLRATHDLADVPMRLTPAIKTAWDKGWHVRVGKPYNDTERRIELLAPYGVIALVWKDSLPNGVWGVFWRNTGNPITRRIDNVNLAIRLGAGEETL